MPRLLASLPRLGFFALMWAGTALIALASLEYFDLETLPAFAIEKLPVRFEDLWLASLRVHVAAALLSMPLCLLLVTRWLQRRAAWHRWLGRITGTLVLFALVPSGVVLAFDAKGGSVVTAGFLLSAAIVTGGMVHGVLSARRRDLVAHRRAMGHVVAQMSVAVTSRAMLVGLELLGADLDVAYVAALWAPVLLSAATIELLLLRSPLALHLVPLFRKVSRELTSLHLFVRNRSVAPPVVGPWR